MPDDANSVFVGSYPDVIFLVDIYKDGYFRFPKKENGNSRF